MDLVELGMYLSGYAFEVSVLMACWYAYRGLRIAIVGDDK